MNHDIHSQGNDFTVGSEPTGIVQNQPDRPDVPYGHELFGAQFQSTDKAPYTVALSGVVGRLTQTIIASLPSHYERSPEDAVFLAGDLMRRFHFGPYYPGRDKDRSVHALALCIYRLRTLGRELSRDNALTIAAHLASSFTVIPCLIDQGDVSAFLDPKRSWRNV